MLAYSGSFVGDGTSSHGITGIGFQPDVVLVKDIGNGYDTWFRTKDMSLNYSLPIRADAAGDTSEILSLDADGFTVGSNIVANGSTHSYVYLALKDDGSGDFSTISFAGNNTDDTLVFSAWQPTYTLLKTTDTVVGAEKFASQGSATGNQSSNLATPNYQGAVDRADLIYFGADGMRVSDGSNSGGNLVNRTGFQTYGFVVKDNSTTIKTGTYSGTGVNNLAVTAGFKPAFVTIHDTIQGQPIGMYATQSAGGNSQQWDGAQQTNLINALTSTGFTLGTSASSNTNGDTVKYLAIAAKNIENFGATSSGTNTTNQTAGGTTTVSHTVGTGTNRVLIVSISSWNNSGGGVGMSSVTYGGVNMTAVGNSIANGDFYTEQWYLVNPASGTANIVATCGGKTDKLGVAGASFTGINQSTPIDVKGSTTGTSGTVTNAITTTASLEYIVDVVSHLSANTATANTGTSILNDGAVGAGVASQYTLGGVAGSNSMSWTYPDPGDGWAYSVLALKAAAGTAFLAVMPRIVRQAVNRAGTY